MKVTVVHHDLFADEAGTQPLMEQVLITQIRPVPPNPNTLPQLEDVLDGEGGDIVYHIGDIVDARLPDEEGDTNIWWLCVVSDMNPKKKVVQCCRCDDGEKRWMPRAMVRLALVWYGHQNTWVPNGLWQHPEQNPPPPSFERSLPPSHNSHNKALSSETGPTSSHTAVGVLCMANQDIFVGEMTHASTPHGWGRKIYKRTHGYQGQFRKGKQHGLGTGWYAFDISKPIHHKKATSKSTQPDVCDFFRAPKSSCPSSSDEFNSDPFAQKDKKEHDEEDSKPQSATATAAARFSKAGVKVHRYSGQWEHDILSGFGIYEYAEGHRCLGRFRHGRLNGPGVMEYPNGARFLGNWADSYLFQLSNTAVRSGPGVYYKKEGIYSGSFLDEKESGLGVMIYRNGSRYEGEWKHGKPHGHGMLFDESGAMYIGSFSQGMKHGYGWTRSAEEVERESIWKRGKIEGLCLLLKSKQHNTRNNSRHKPGISSVSSSASSGGRGDRGRDRGKGKEDKAGRLRTPGTVTTTVQSPKAPPPSGRKRRRAVKSEAEPPSNGDRKVRKSTRDANGKVDAAVYANTQSAVVAKLMSDGNPKPGTIDVFFSLKNEAGGTERSYLEDVVARNEALFEQFRALRLSVQEAGRSAQKSAQQAVEVQQIASLWAKKAQAAAWEATCMSEQAKGGCTHLFSAMCRSLAEDCVLVGNVTTADQEAAFVDRISSQHHHYRSESASAGGREYRSDGGESGYHRGSGSSSCRTQQARWVSVLSFLPSLSAIVVLVFLPFSISCFLFYSSVISPFLVSSFPFFPSLAPFLPSFIRNQRQ
jgi:hypothetical protein